MKKLPKTFDRNFVIYVSLAIVCVSLLSWTAYMVLKQGPRVEVIQTYSGEVEEVQVNEYVPQVGSEYVAACDGENRPDRVCKEGFTQACVKGIVCRCADGWVSTLGPMDGCVKWQGAYISESAESYSFVGECTQACRLTGRAQ